MKYEVFFDVETKKLFSEIEDDDPGKLGVSVVSLFQREFDEENKKELSGGIASFWEDEFEEMWPIFQKADRIIGFNSISFDVPALMAYSQFSFNKLPHFDIMQKVKEVFGRRIGLAALTQETLDRNKIDDGLSAVLYWKKHDKDSLSKLKKYCEDDVLLTKDLYDFVYHNGYLQFKDKWNTLRKVELDFSYPQSPITPQIGLF